MFIVVMPTIVLSPLFSNLHPVGVGLTSVHHERSLVMHGSTRRCVDNEVMLSKGELSASV